MIDRLAIATKNRHKAVEMAAILARVLPGVAIVDDVDWPDVEETGETLEDNARLKARAVADATGVAALADDTGLEVEALGGSPGVRSARFAGTAATFADNRAKLLRHMEGVSDRRARFRTVVVLASPDGSEAVAEGHLAGVITESERGFGGFGYDAVFEVGGRTLAEMSDEEKNRLSHRANAIGALTEALGAGGTGTG